MARQNKSGKNYSINLGGPESEINRPDFKGLILLDPFEHLAFGVCPDKIISFFNKVMEIKNGKYQKKSQVLWRPNERNRVVVNFVEEKNI